VTLILLSWPGDHYHEFLSVYYLGIITVYWPCLIIMTCRLLSWHRGHCHDLEITFITLSSLSWARDHSHDHDILVLTWRTLAWPLYSYNINIMVWTPKYYDNKVIIMTWRLLLWPRDHCHDLEISSRDHFHNMKLIYHDLEILRSHDLELIIIVWWSLSLLGDHYHCLMIIIIAWLSLSLLGDHYYCLVIIIVPLPLPGREEWEPRCRQVGR
jgi:hypothetical protein